MLCLKEMTVMEQSNTNNQVLLRLYDYHSALPNEKAA